MTGEIAKSVLLVKISRFMEMFIAILTSKKDKASFQVGPEKGQTLTETNLT